MAGRMLGSDVVGQDSNTTSISWQ